jgi:hypothetical protein
MRVAPFQHTLQDLWQSKSLQRNRQYVNLPEQWGPSGWAATLQQVGGADMPTQKRLPLVPQPCVPLPLPKGSAAPYESIHSSFIFEAYSS